MSHRDADVLVIGAGFTGAMIANTLAQSGRRVAVVDAARVASGSTRLLPGVLTADPAAGEAGQQSYEHLAQLGHARGWDLVDATVTLASSGTADQPRLSALGSQPGLCGALDAIIHDLLSSPSIMVREGLEISGLDSEPDHGTMCALADGYTLRAGECVLATGAFTASSDCKYSGETPLSHTK